MTTRDGRTAAAGPVVRPRGSGWRALLCAATVLAAAGCTRQPVAVAVPTFPAEPSRATAAPPVSPPPTGLPTDCAQLLGQDEVPALLGLPEDSVAVATVWGQPAPTVGRLQKVDCTYTLVEGSEGGVVLRVTAGLYQDDAVTRDQHERNVADQRAGAVGSVRPRLGGASATMVRHRADDVLLTCYHTLTLDLVLPSRPSPLAPVDLLTDVARRVLARLGADRWSTPVAAP